METIRVIPSGYCKGVIGAINIAKKARIDYPDAKIYVLGMIVHNSYVTAQLAKLDIITLDDSHKSKAELLDEIKEGVVIFTAHGIADDIVEKAQRKGLITINASCVDVLKTRDIIKKHLQEGFDILYFGKNHHPEAEAILSISPNIHLLSKKEDVLNLNIANPKIFLTNQTTMSMLELKELIELVKERYPSVIIQEEICNATSSRQQAIIDLKDCELLYVVGDTKSNNTNKLKDIALKQGIKEVHLISCAADIKKDDLKGHQKVHVTAGASTPPELIQEVIDLLRAETP